MFLIERLAGVGIYTYVLVVVCFLIAFSNGDCRKLLKFYILLLCIMGFFYEPYVTADLYRLHETMAWYATIDFDLFFDQLVVTTSVPLSRLLFWLIGRIGILELVSVLSVFVCYSAMFYIIHRTQSLYGISRKNVAVTLFLLMETSIFISVAGGIRMMVGMSLIAWCFFRESVEHKVNLLLHALLYVSAVLMHNLSIVIIALRFLVLVFDSRVRRGIRIAVILAVAAAALAAVARFATHVAEVMASVMGYLSEESFSDKWEYLIGVILAVGLLALGRKYRSLGCVEKYPMLRSYNMAMNFSTATAILFARVFSIFYRFVGHLSPILAIPMLMVTLEEAGHAPSRRRFQLSFQSTVLIFGAVIALLSCSRGSMSSLKFFALG